MTDKIRKRLGPVSVVATIAVLGLLAAFIALAALPDIASAQPPPPPDLPPAAGTTPTPPTGDGPPPPPAPPAPTEPTAHRKLPRPALSEGTYLIEGPEGFRGYCSPATTDVHRGYTLFVMLDGELVITAGLQAMPTSRDC